VLRILLRDLDAHPDPLEDVWTAIRSNVYDVFAAWLRAQTDAGTLAVDDPQATGAVLLASSPCPPILKAPHRAYPGDIDAVLIAAAAFGAAYNTLVATSVRWATRLDPDRPATGVATATGSQGIGLLCGPLTGGLITASTSLTIALLGGAVILLLLAAALAPRTDVIHHDQTTEAATA